MAEAPGSVAPERSPSGTPASAAEAAGSVAPGSTAHRAASVEALRITLGRPPVWLVVWTMEVLLAIAPALAWHSWFTQATANRYEPGSLFGNLDTAFRFDQRAATGALDSALGVAGGALAFLAMLVGCFCAGGWLQVFLERTHGHSLQRFFLGGARYFWRFFRLMLVSILALSLVSWLVYGPAWNHVVLRWMFGIPTSDFDRLETLSSERIVVGLRWSQQGLHALLFGLVLVWGDYSRARLALHDTASAVWAGLCTFFTLLRHPVKTLRPMIALLLLEVAIVLAAGLFARAVEEDVGRRPELAGVGILLLSSQIVLVWRVILRGARYHAAVHVSREVVRPIARPDPWKASLGAPGGPRYPIGGDEYGMSL